jgi:hypothetical protein|tara:strand:- start:709 stop:861 length:153 start_codon:yes stop_codon:yes gene_type:complete
MFWEFAIIEKFSSGLLVGFSYYPNNEDNEFNELNIYCLLFALHFKFYNKE